MNLENFKNFNLANKLNNLVQICLIIFLMVGAVVIAESFHSSFDISASRDNSLSAETVAYISRLDSDIEIIVVANDFDNCDIASFPRRLSRLFEAYENAFKSFEKTLKINYIKAIKQPNEVIKLKEIYGITEDYSIIIVAKKHFKVLTPKSFYTDEKSEKFQGEAILTTAILGVTQEKQKTIYWLTGHGEYFGQNINVENGASNAYKELIKNNFDVKFLEHCTKIPSDADMIVIIGPQMPFLKEEIDALTDYIDNKNGRILMLLHPVYENSFGDFLKNFGILLDMNILLDFGDDFISSSSSLIIRRLKPHQLTNLLIKENVGLLFGLIRPIMENASMSERKRSSIVPFIYSSETSFAKKNYDLNKLEFDSNQDVKGPIPLGIAMERDSKTDVGIKISGGRLIVIGCADWITNARFHSLGNRWLFMNCFKWALEREDMLDFPPKTVDSFSVTISAQKLLSLAISFAVLPIIVIFVGVFVFIYRRN